MNTSTSEYSEGCESGWTMYLDQLSSSANQCNRSNMPLDIHCRSKGVYVNEDDDEGEDSSMISDASSGPPHFHQDEYSSEATRYNSTISASEQKRGKHRKKVKEQHKKNQQNFHLDDTASSPLQCFSKNNAVPDNDKYLMENSSAGFSQGFSATQSKEKTVLRKHFGFLKPSHDRKS
ncbi:hypothetical protein ACH5RR_027087 [Cinchona calisaya]|uniref:Uncharacterized protein n=1 Tax=Cinchona calisaya TaxID=153742 RepID=A0ABD2Z4H9_9GENT